MKCLINLVKKKPSIESLNNTMNHTKDRTMRCEDKIKELNQNDKG